MGLRNCGVIVSVLGNFYFISLVFVFFFFFFLICSLRLFIAWFEEYCISLLYFFFLFFVEASLPRRLDNQKPRCSCWRYNTVTWEMLNRNVESCILKKISFFFFKKKMCFLKTWFWNPRTLKCLVKHVEIIIWKLLNFCCGHKLPKEIFPFFVKVTKDSFVCVCVWGEDGTKKT